MHPDDSDMRYVFCHKHIHEAKEMLKNKDLSKISIDTKKMNDEINKQLL